MKLLTTKPPKRRTKFADFISSASAAEKKKVYARVLKEASDSQRRIVEAAEALPAKSA